MFSSNECRDNDAFSSTDAARCWGTVWARLCVVDPTTTPSMSMSMSMMMTTSKSSKSGKRNSESRKLHVEDGWTRTSLNTDRTNDAVAEAVAASNDFKEWMEGFNPQKKEQPKKFLRD